MNVKGTGPSSVMVKTSTPCMQLDGRRKRLIMVSNRGYVPVVGAADPGVDHTRYIPSAQPSTRQTNRVNAQTDISIRTHPRSGCDNSISGDTWWRHVRTQTNQTPVAFTSARAVNDVIASPLDIAQALVIVRKRNYPC